MSSFSFPSLKKNLPQKEYVKQLKIEHRETVGTLLGIFERLDKSRSQIVDTAIKKINALKADCKTQAKTKAEEPIPRVAGFHQQISGLILLHGSAVFTATQEEESTTKTLTRRA